MSEVFTTRRRVEFRDTDAAGIMHFSVFLSMMEEVEHEFLRSVGLHIISKINGDTISWPRVHADCNYRQPVVYDDELEIQVTVVRLGNKSVTYGFHFFHNGDLIADGTIIAACCQMVHGQRPRSIPIPMSFRQTLADYQASVSQTR